MPPVGPELPKLVILKFDGKIINWQTFWDQTEFSLDSQENIADINKFGYEIYCVSARETFGT